jgi:putative spermidine/putrescine transport system permease protein
MVSNIIDFHMRKSLNWNLAAALGLVMLVFVMFLFWVYDRVVGIDNMKLG